MDAGRAPKLRYTVERLQTKVREAREEFTTIYIENGLTYTLAAYMCIDCFWMVLKKMPTIIASGGKGQECYVDCSLSPSPTSLSTIPDHFPFSAP